MPCTLEDMLNSKSLQVSSGSTGRIRVSTTWRCCLSMAALSHPSDFRNSWTPPRKEPSWRTSRWCEPHFSFFIFWGFGFACGNPCRLVLSQLLGQSHIEAEQEQKGSGKASTCRPQAARSPSLQSSTSRARRPKS